MKKSNITAWKHKSKNMRWIDVQYLAEQLRWIGLQAGISEAGLVDHGILVLPGNIELWAYIPKHPIKD